jgi:hypothetical protein
MSLWNSASYFWVSAVKREGSLSSWPNWVKNENGMDFKEADGDMDRNKGQQTHIRTHLLIQPRRYSIARNVDEIQASVGKHRLLEGRHD